MLIPLLLLPREYAATMSSIPTHDRSALNKAEDALVVNSFLSLPRKIPPPSRNGSTSTLVVRNGPYGPYRAHYSHAEKRFIALEYRDPHGEGSRTVVLPLEHGTRR